MTFSLIHPSIRPDKWREIYDAWLKAAKHPDNVEYILMADEKWGFDYAAVKTTFNPVKSYVEDGGVGSRSMDMLFLNDGGYVASVNAAAKEAVGDVLIVIADDIWPAEGWDEALADAHQHYFTGNLPNVQSAEFAIWVNNGDRHIGTRGDIMAMPVVSRSRVERLGYLYYPKYMSMYADNDLAEHCQLDAKEGRCSLIVLDQPVFPHKHPANDQTVPMDAAYQWQNRPEAYSEGLRIFKARRAAEFGEITLPPKKRRIAVCVAGQQFSVVWLARWTELMELGQDFDLPIVFAWGGTNVYHTRIGMARNVLQLETCDFALFIDDDQLVTLDQVKQLIEDLDQNPDVSLVAGWTLTGMDYHEIGQQVSCGFVDDQITSVADLMAGPDDLLDVTYTGFPLVLMRVDLIREVGPESFWPEWHGEGLPMGEDVSFCHMARAFDKKIRVDRRVGPLPHLKLRDIAAGAIA